MALADAQRIRLWFLPGRGRPKRPASSRGAAKSRKAKPRSNKRSAAKISWDERLRRAGLIAVGAAALIAVSVALVIAYQAMLASSLFGLSRLTLTGQERLGQSQVLTLAGLKPGMNLLRIDPEAVRLRLLASPWVAEAAVRRVLPDELRIHITERRPVAVVMADRPWFMDENGVAFKTVDPGEELDLPVVTGLSESDLSGVSGRRLLAEVKEVVRSTRQKNAALRLSDLSEIQVDARKGRLVLHPQNRGPRVILGRRRAVDGLAGLGRVKADLKAKGLWGRATYIDLRFKDKAYVGFKTG